SFLARKFIHDEGFKSSIKFAAAIGLFPIWYTILTCIAMIFVPHWYLALLTGPILFALGALALIWQRTFSRFRAMLKYNRLVSSNNSDLKKVKEVRNSIIEVVTQLNLV